MRRFIRNLYRAYRPNMRAGRHQANSLWRLLYQAQLKRKRTIEHAGRHVVNLFNVAHRNCAVTFPSSIVRFLLRWACTLTVGPVSGVRNDFFFEAKNFFLYNSLNQILSVDVSECCDGMFITPLQKLTH